MFDNSSSSLVGEKSPLEPKESPSKFPESKVGEIK